MTRRQKPAIKISEINYSRIKKEWARLNIGKHSKISMGELVELIIEIYLNNQDVFRDLTAGAVGTQPVWAVEENDNRPQKIKISIQADLFSER